MKTRFGKVTVAEILKAFKATGFTPKFGGWMSVDKGETCACAITTYTRYKCGTLPKSLTMLNFAEFLGTPVNHLDSFTDGFDGNEPEEDTDREIYNLGVLSREAIGRKQKLAN